MVSRSIQGLLLLVAVAALQVAVVAGSSSTAVGSGCIDGPGISNSEAGVEGIDGGFVGHGNQSQGASGASSGESCDSVRDYVYEPVCVMANHTCVPAKCGEGGHWHDLLEVHDDGGTESKGLVCLGGNKAPLVESGMVLEEMKRIGLQPPVLVVQPPGGKTLVNLDTIFSTDGTAMTRDIRVAGMDVRVRIWASSFSWRFGDGSRLVTSEPGRTYRRGLPMDSYITHRYTDAGVTVHPRVDTTYSAEYSVDGGPFQPVIGTVTIEGESVGIQVVEARPALTGER